MLQRERLGDAPAVQSYSTPRRLAVLASGVSSAQPDVSEQVTGPSLKVAYKDGVPTAAAEAFARKVNVPVDALEKVTTPKGEYLAATVQKKGRPAAENSCRIAAQRNCRDLLGQEHVLAGQVGGALRASGALAGHAAGWGSGAAGIRRHSSGTNRRPSHSVVGTVADKAARRLFLDLGQRLGDRHCGGARAADPQSAGCCNANVTGARWREDETLLDTVVNLTEFPSVVLGSFDPEFLSLADEVLVTVMRDHQKYFALEDAEGKLLAAFSRGAQHFRRPRD